MRMISQVSLFSDILNIHDLLAKLCYGKIIQVFGEFTLLGFHLRIWNLAILHVFSINLHFGILEANLR